MRIEGKCVGRDARGADAEEDAGGFLLGVGGVEWVVKTVFGEESGFEEETELWDAVDAKKWTRMVFFVVACSHSNRSNKKR